MKKILYVITVNLLSLLSLPLLFIACVCKLISKTFEKFSYLAVGLCYAFLIFSYLQIISAPTTTKDIFFLLLSSFVFFLLFFGISFLLLHALNGFLNLIWNFFMGFFQVIYEKCYSTITYFGKICRNYTNYLNHYFPPVMTSLLCFLFTFYRILFVLIMTLIKCSLAISILGCSYILIRSVYDKAKAVQNIYGMDILDYIAKFNGWSILFAIGSYLCVLGLILFSIYSLGMECNEWAMEMSLPSGNTKKQIATITDMAKKDAIDSFKSGAYKSYLAKYQEQVKGLEQLNSDISWYEKNAPQREYRKLKNLWEQYISHMYKIACICYDSGSSSMKEHTACNMISNLPNEVLKIKSTFTHINQVLDAEKKAA